MPIMEMKKNDSKISQKSQTKSDKTGRKTKS